MPTFAIFKTIKFWAIVLPLLGVVAVGYFAVREYTETLKQNTQLKVELSGAKAEAKALKDAYRVIGEAVDKTETNTRTIIERTQTVEKQINAQPITKDCLATPSVGVALRVLREQSASESKDPVSSEPVQVP